MSSIPEVFTKFRKTVEKEAEVRQPIIAPLSIACPTISKDLQEIDAVIQNLQLDSRHALPELGGERGALKYLNT